MANPRITVEINGDSSGLHKELGKSSQGVMGFASELKGLAASVGLAFGAAQVISFGRSLLRDAENATTLAKELDIPLAKIIALKEMGEQTGIPFEKLTAMLMKAADAGSRLIEQGSDGSIAKKFEKAGLDSYAFAAMDAADKLEYLVKNTGDADTAISLLNETLGRSTAVTARELFDGQTESLKKLAEQAGLTEEAYKRLTAAQDKLDKASATVKAESITAIGRAIEVYERAKMTTDGGTWGKIGAGFATGGIVLASWLDKLTGMNAAQDMLAMYPKLPTPQKEEKKPEKKNPLTASDEAKAGDGTKYTLDQVYQKMQIENETKAAADAAKRTEKRQGIIDQGESNRADIIKQGRSAVDGITVSMPRLSGIESLGAVLGGSGGAARSAAERSIRIMEIQKDTLAKIDENTKKTAERLEE